MMETGQQSTPFHGVHFLLLGFDHIHQNQVRSKLVNGGGVEVNQYCDNCTHVIVDTLVYDDSVCVAARRDGKTLVTGLWVDHCYDIGMPVDPTSIMYRPLKDLNGIPGAKSLVMCLTGYQRQDRDDIMTMVGLMGAQFSKPLVANKVTHLICYKFEGEKYELAKKMKRIKLVNHRWLEDCLSAWELLPEANYSKSGHELETEAEAKDSEEEAEDTATMHFRGRNTNMSPNLQTGTPRAHELPVSAGEVSKIGLDATSTHGASNVLHDEGVLLTTVKETRFEAASSLPDVNKDPEVPGCQDTATCELSDAYDRTPTSTKWASTPRSTKRSPDPDTAQLSSISYSRKNPRRSSLQGEISSKLQPGVFMTSDRLDVSPLKVEQTKDGIDSGCIKTPLKGFNLAFEEESSGILPQKRKMAASSSNPKLQKMSCEKPCISGTSLIGNSVQGLDSTPVINGSPEANISSSLSNKGHHPDEIATLNSLQNSPGSTFTSKSSCKNKSLACDLPAFKSVSSEIKQDGNVEEEAHKKSFGRLEGPALPSKPDNLDFGTGRSAHEVGEAGKLPNQHQDIGVSPLDAQVSVIEKTHSRANLELLEGENDNSLSKSPTTKRITKKSLGTRPKLSRGNTANQKGSIHFNRVATQNDAVIPLSGGKEAADYEEPSSTNKHKVAPATFYEESVMDMKAKDFLAFGNDVERKIDSMDDETEAPEDKGENEFYKEAIEICDTIIEEKPEGEQLLTYCIKEKVDHVMASEEGKNEPESGQAIGGKKIELGNVTSKTDALVGKNIKERKRPLRKTKIETAISVKENAEHKEPTDGAVNRNKENIEKTMLEQRASYSGKNQSSTVPVNTWENSMEAEKENKPIIYGNQIKGKEHAGKLAVKSNEMPMKTDQIAGNCNPDTVQVGRVAKRVKTEPMWFILSGHKLQRKDFQKVIGHLRGRFCRDSHHWSYQATHFIVPDPIRRTEKFFAAAASGRWILKSDYLTASNQAGKFLAEEPYEWHKNGLSEDGAINLEAPRKWRLVRERTGHGAFYGMRIIIYGECIAPPLDTLKRVVKAGDGTILATSPPYTRFLNSGVDFAIVSPGMPRVDLWVQEFLKHKITCVVPDYLVEYVCKPGYSLERHVQYNTHAWAERSFANLLSRSEEIVEDLTPPDDHVSDDLTCQVCGSRDRGEVMLICGDESGSVGCGVGTHIHCCNPPLEDVPEENWLCPSCRSKDGTNPPEHTKKRTSLKSK